MGLFEDLSSVSTATFEIGPNCTCQVSFNNYGYSQELQQYHEGQYIVTLRCFGSGYMYNSTLSFTCIGGWYANRHGHGAGDEISEAVRNELTWGYIKNVLYTQVRIFPVSYKYCAEISINNGILNIIDYMFYNVLPKAIYLGDSIETIGIGAFQAFEDSEIIDSEKLGDHSETLIRLPRNLISIGNKAFANLPFLNTIIFNPDSYYSFPNNNNSFYVSQNIINYNKEYYSHNIKNNKFKTEVYSNNSNIYKYDWITQFNRIITNTPYEIIGTYACYDQQNGYQFFPIYDKPGQEYSRAIYIKSLYTIGYIHMTDIEDTQDGGNRVQYVSSKDKIYRYVKEQY